MAHSDKLDSMAALNNVLAKTVPNLHAHCRNPWTLIGSAAARLIGAEVAVADLDVLTSARDARMLGELWHARRDSGHESADATLFRSRFARFRFPPMPVEIMGDMQLCGETGWEAVQAGEIRTLDLAGLAVPVPELPDQIRLLQSFGRPKDMQRAALLQPIATATGSRRNMQTASTS